jgi:hypothetical protein
VSVDEWVQIFLAVGTVAAAILAYVAIRKGSRSETKVSGETRMRELARAEQEPLRDHLVMTDQRVAQISVTTSRIETTLDKVDSTVDQVRERVAGVEATQIRLIEQINMNLAKLLHQPDPRRGHVDHLLENYMEGTLTDDERTELKKYLIMIRNYEPDKTTLPFPVYPGEQTAAAILLGTMDLVAPDGMARYGHSSHRTVMHDAHPEDEEHSND